MNILKSVIVDMRDGGGALMVMKICIREIPFLKSVVDTEEAVMERIIQPTIS